MKIRLAKKSDKEQILSFCRHTFRWGDYIDRIWDQWFAQKNLLVAEKKNKAIGICNVGISPNQIWIEGIRINPNFRKKGYASRLVIAAEAIARKKNLKFARMIIADNNKRSLRMARSLGYTLEDKWWLYNLIPKKENTIARLAKNSKNLDELIQSNTYSESWNWLPLNKSSLSKLVKLGRVIIYSKNKKVVAMGIWNKTSKLDNDVMQLGYLNGTKEGIKNILQFMQNMGFKENSDRIQILVQHQIKINMKGIDRRMLFSLMKKEL